MSLLENFVMLLKLWRPAFTKIEAFRRARDHAIALILLCGKSRNVTITQIANQLGHDTSSYTSDCKLYAESKWNPNDLFDALLPKCEPFCHSKYVTLASDDTRVGKTGKTIPGTSWHRDPLSPPFHTNFKWGLRFLQTCIILPLHNDGESAPRALPIRFIDAPLPQKPRRNASEQELENYKAASDAAKIPKVFVKTAKELRKAFDKCPILKNKILIHVLDGSFCNQTIFKEVWDRAIVIARCRKDAKLSFPPDENNSRRKYGEAEFTPEEVRQDETIEWKTLEVYYGGCKREIRYKELQVQWRKGGGPKLQRLVVIAPTPYWKTKGGRKYYREPSYLLCNDLDLPIELLIQAYFDRWQIEVVFREEKSVFGVGEAQVWSDESVARQPALQVATYSAFMLAHVLSTGDKKFKEGNRMRRMTLRRLRKRLLEDSQQEPDLLERLNLSVHAVFALLGKAA